MNKEAFAKKMLGFGRAVMIAKLSEWCGDAGRRAAESMSTAELVDVMWGFAQCGRS